MEDPLQKVLAGRVVQNGNDQRKKFLSVLSVALILVILGALYFIHQRQKNTTASAPNSPQIINESQALIVEVSKLISLPQDEEPTIATVSDPKLLQSQAFFASAKIGDKVLIYVKAKKAILYDPVVKKIVEVAPLNIKTKHK